MHLAAVKSSSEPHMWMPNHFYGADLCGPHGVSINVHVEKQCVFVCVCVSGYVCFCCMCVLIKL